MLTPWRALLLAAWLLGAQQLGLAHSTSHAAAHPPAHPLTALLAPLASADDAWHAGHAAGSTECRLLDQLLGSVDALLATPAALHTLAPADQAVPLPAEPAAHRPGHCHYQARAPPLR